MHLEIAADAAGGIGGLGDALRIQPERTERLRHRNALRIDSVQELAIELAADRAASQERRTVANAFFFAETDHVDPERQPPTAERLHRRHAQQHAEHPVVFPGIRNGVEMRPDHEHRRRGTGSLVVTDQVPGRIAVNVIPAARIQPVISWCSPRIGSLRNVRVILPGSSVNEAT